MKRRYWLIPMTVLGCALAPMTKAESTALNLVAKGDDYVGVQSKDKVVEIISDKSAGALAPNVWHIDYYDPDAPMKYVEVKFGAGQEMDVSHPIRPFELPASGSSILDKSKLKVDSDQALTIASGQALLKPLTLKAAKMTLTHGDLGPVWKIQLWAAKLSDPAHEAGVGTIILSATDGSVVKSDLRPDKAD